MKKILFVLALSTLACLMLVSVVAAKDVYLEDIPEELKFPDDIATHFVVFEEEKYYTGSGDTINGFNTDQMNADMDAAGIDPSKIGKEYLTRFNVPATLNGTLVTYVNLNSMKTHGYFYDKCGYVQLAGTVSKVHDMNDATDHLRCIDFGENSQIKEIPLCFAATASRIKALKNFPRNLTLIDKDAFNKCYNAFSGEFYLNAVTIKDGAFNNAFNHTTGLILGPNVKTIGNQSLCTRLPEVPNSSRPAGNILPLKYIEFQCDITQVSFAKQGTNLGVFYFEGASRTPFSSLECIILSHPNNASKITEGTVFNDLLPEGTIVLFNDSDGANDYVTASHTYGNTELAYGSFLENGALAASCVKCGCTVSKSTDAIFECLGYSVSTFGVCGFSIGYKVNFDALADYETATGLTLNYGIVAVAKSNLGDKTPFDENGNATVLDKGAVLFAKINSSTKYFDGCLSKFSTDEQKNAEIIICAYTTLTDEEGKIVQIQYLQSGNTNGGALSSVSYNSLASALPNE